MSVEAAGGGLGGDFTYTRYLADLRAYFSSGPTQIVKSRLLLGTTGGDAYLPFQRTFAIGGIGTLERGKEILLEQGENRVPALSVPLMMSNAAPGMLAMRYGLLGDGSGLHHIWGMSGGTGMAVLSFGVVAVFALVLGVASIRVFTRAALR